MTSVRKRDNGVKGKILRVKKGYNPNSSSIGSMVFALPVAFLGITAAFGAVSGIIMAAFMTKTGKSDSKKQDAPDRSENSANQPNAKEDKQ